MSPTSRLSLLPSFEDWPVQGDLAVMALDAASSDTLFICGWGGCSVFVPHLVVFRGWLLLAENRNYSWQARGDGGWETLWDELTTS